MLRFSQFKTLFLTLLVLGTTGCSFLPPFAGSESENKPLLRPAKMSDQAISLDVLFVRCKLKDVEINEEMWNEIDESKIPAELRKRLNSNGFRVGVVGGTIPNALEKLLYKREVTFDKELEEQESELDKPENQVAVDKVPKIKGRYIQIQPGKRAEIQVSSIYEKLSLVLSDEGKIDGDTFLQAQGVLALTAEPNKGNSINICLTPEIHHGAARQRYVATSEASWKIAASREKKVYSNLKTQLSLAPGEMLILSCRPEIKASMGFQFCTDELSGELEQKLIILRRTDATFLKF